MAGVLRGVVSQRLLPRIGGGRVAAVEVMLTNARIADLIREQDGGDPRGDRRGQPVAMQSFTKALIDHVVPGTST